MYPPPGRKNASPRDLMNGGVLQCVEAATLGMPFEVWKTRMGRYRRETTLEAFRNVMKEGGGIAAFWAGTGPKMVESATKGAILLYSKEAIANSLLSMGVGEGLTGFAAGAGGGVCQVVVMGPCTFLVTAAVTGDKSITTSQRISNVFAARGIKGFYPGGTAIAFRQATNWASRQGFTEIVRGRFKLWFHGDKNARLTVPQEAASGIIGGALACWNHPFEVARIQMQSAADRGEPQQNMMQVFRTVIKEQGYPGLFKGIIPRLGLGIWQTLFMVTGAKLVKQALSKD
uniref:Mitochondrial Carrier (MC) Family putative n=1 Tax=Albugo laibachii Nc14 TaxID=890382 RepID=F0W200_9STRA|nr:Mitochondrial Carrier (MC) Family putative [Albugo laibachii Nc14]|eukprot:CCA15079.1 Mitochondrial Carrier (MC) Family putative [Albugo laibachii Nc14]